MFLFRPKLKPELWKPEMTVLLDYLTWYWMKYEFDHVMCNATMSLVSLSRRLAKWISASWGEDSPPCNINQNGNKVKVVTSKNSLTNQYVWWTYFPSTVAKSEVGLSSKMPVSPTVIVKKNHPLGCHNLQIHLNAMQTVNINLHDRENKCWQCGVNIHVLLVHQGRNLLARKC